MFESILMNSLSVISLCFKCAGNMCRNLRSIYFPLSQLARVINQKTFVFWGSLPELRVIYHLDEVLAQWSFGLKNKIDVWIYEPSYSVIKCCINKLKIKTKTEGFGP